MAPIDLSAGATIEQRVTDATVRCVARWGLTKTTLDDVAREAGCSRATIYRAFPGGKDALVAASIRAECERLGRGLAGAVAGLDTLEDVLVAAIVHTGRFLSGHQALRFLLAHEPEVVLPRVSFARMRQVLADASEFAAPFLAPFVGPHEAPRVAEWVARIIFSYTMAPSTRVDVCDEESVRELVRDFVLPGLGAGEGAIHVVH
jgi:AcrR family transcriptional regulator